MKKHLGLILALSAYTWWGIIPIYWKLLDHVAPMQIVSHRMVWSFVLVTLLVFLLGQGPQLLKTFKDRATMVRLFFASTFVTLNWAVFIWAVNSGHLMETSMGYFINPLINVLVGVLWFKERLRLGQMLAVLVATLGVLILVAGIGEVPWIALSLGITFTLYSVMKKSVSLPATHGMSIETLYFVLPAIAYLLWQHQQGVGDFNLDLKTDFLLVLGGLFTLIPLTLFAAAAKRVTLITLGMSQYIGPTLQFLTAVFLFKEPLGETRLLAFCFIWFALVIYSVDMVKAQRSRRKVIDV